MHKILLFLVFNCSFLLLVQAQSLAINKPIENFEFLWHTFNERYANFELKKVNWDSIYTIYRPQITEQTNNQELFEICCAMLQELKDGHVTLEPSLDDPDAECGPPYTFTLEEEFTNKEEWLAFEEVMDKNLLAYGFSAAHRYELSEESNFQYRTSADFAYLRIDDMPELLFSHINRALDASLAAFEGKKAAIIDLRFNGGGWDRNAYRIANRFVCQKHIGHYKHKRKRGSDEFGKLRKWMLKPKGKVQFTEQIIILTSDYTASAAEVLVLALQQFPNVMLIGQTTEGIFSDMYYFKMPNKWEASLSHLRFYSSEMVNYEGIGIQPDIQVSNSKKDIEQMTDAVLEQVMLFLNKN